MLLDLNDSASIVRWYEIFPNGHGALLANWRQRRPKHRGPIERARRLIKADPRLRTTMRMPTLMRGAVPTGTGAIVIP